jgi:3-hydroxyacyl-CoA dehydrogenase
MRFANPVQEMTKLEIVRAPATDDETIAACAEVGRRMGKQVVVVSDGLRRP